MNIRKPIRLENYDYSQNGAYFITICVKDRLPILSEISASAVGASIARPKDIRVPKPELTDIGLIVERAIQSIPLHYENISVDKYVIMPNHVHLLIRIDSESGRAMLAPTGISGIVQQMKGYVTKQYGKAIWQKSFYDHVIRSERDYLEIWQYIDGNPAKWSEDELFVMNSDR